MALIPTTILTGFLGAGKTTLLKRILQEQHGHKIAVIENEFGEESIDNEILVQEDNEQIVEMNNGCICCTVRGDLIDALSMLAQKKRDGLLDFERVVIETTGLANPGPVAQTFFIDETVGTYYMLDAIVTVVDARHAPQQLDAHEEAQRQVGFADKLLLSKTDLVDAQQLEALQQRLHHMNPRAPVCHADFGKVAIDEVLDLRGFNLNDKLELDPDFLQADEHEHAHEHEHCGEHCEHEHHPPHDEVAAFVFKSERPFAPAKLELFLSSMLQAFGPSMLRYKGILYMEGAAHKVVFQGVHQIMGTDVGAKWAENEQPNSKMVFIGKNLPKDVFIQGLTQCLV